MSTGQCRECSPTFFPWQLTWQIWFQYDVNSEKVYAIILVTGKILVSSFLSIIPAAMPLAGIWCLNWANYSLSPTGNCGIWKGKGRQNREPSGLPSGWHLSRMPASPEACRWGRACPRTPGLPFDPAGGTLPKPAACYWMAQPGSFFGEGAVLLHKASQSGPLSIIVINSNKMSEQGCPDRTCLWAAPSQERRTQCVAASGPLTQPRAVCILDFWPCNGSGGGLGWMADTLTSPLAVLKRRGSL